MAATQYMLMFKYINTNTNKPITNDLNNPYEEDFHIITDGHAYRQGDVAWAEKIDNLLIEGNNFGNTKQDMIFVYDGTIKMPHYTGGTSLKYEGTDWTKPSTIPASYPYVVKDKYIRINMAPWFPLATYGSLNAALKKAEQMADMIGLDNLKLIKIVPFGQKIKIV